MDFGTVSRRSFLATAASPLLVANTVNTRFPAEYPLLRASGSHRELGRQHGEQASEKIKAHVGLLANDSRLSRDQLRERTAAFRPLFQKYCPHLLEEIQGLAEGARISATEALAVNIRGALGRPRQEGCTAYAIGRSATAQKEIVAGQNSDMTTPIPPLAYVLHLKPLNKPEVLIWTFGGMIGYHGMNSAGVAHFANDLGGGPASRFGMPHYPLKRMMLECDSVEQVLRLCEKVPVSSNGNYVLCDGHGGILDIELTTAGPEVLKDGDSGYLAHTNHFLCSRYALKENFERSWKDSFPRLDRFRSLVRPRLGLLSVPDIKKFLADHQGYPTSICRHDGDSRTVASLISEPAQRQMHVAVGNPCENRYVTYRI
jgi:isopenicillin-N N-acyltransferase-like protein